MSLEIPELDDRTFADLVAAAVERIPIHTDEWTDHNPHDPGITVLELLAWVAEAYGYRLDRITDEHVRKYLALVGVTPREPVPATVRVELAEPGGAAGRRLPAGTRLLATSGTTDRTFTTTRAGRLTAATVVRVVVEHARGRTDHTTADATDGLHYPAFGERAAAGSALYVGFDADPFAGPREGDERVPLELYLDYHDADLPTPATHGEEPAGFEPSVALAWEYCTDHGDWWDDANWREIDVPADGTRSLYEAGTVTLGPPEDDWDLVGAATEPVLDGPPGPVWLRCRLATPGYEVAPRLDGVRTNVVDAAHREPRGPTVLVPAGRGAETPLAVAGNDGGSVAAPAGVDGEPTATARPGQVFEFGDAPVLDPVVVVETPDGTRTTWAEVRDFDASGPDDGHYVRDATAGTIAFGDGRRGAVPPAGATVVAERYAVGGSAAGNVAPGARWRIGEVPPVDDGSQRDDSGDEPLPNPVRDALAGTEVVPLAPPAGGTDAETTAAALRHAREDRRRPYRCVTLGDYATVAADTPGLRVGRTTAWVEAGAADPPDPTIHVVVVPYAGGTVRPVPSEGFLAAVREHVERHRLVTDRVRVDPPTYVPVRVDAEVRIVSGYAALDVERTAAEAIDRFLDPLWGFEGDGWPFGRPLYLSELYDALADVPGVERVFDVTARVDPTAGGATSAPTEDAEGSISIPAEALFDPGGHRVTVRTDGRGRSP